MGSVTAAPRERVQFPDGYDSRDQEKPFLIFMNRPCGSAWLQRQPCTEQGFSSSCLRAAWAWWEKNSRPTQPRWLRPCWEVGTRSCPRPGCEFRCGQWFLRPQPGAQRGHPVTGPWEAVQAAHQRPALLLGGSQGEQDTVTPPGATASPHGL